MLGIIVAMEDELDLNSLNIKNIKCKEINNQKFYFLNKKIIFTYSGIGKINSSIATFNLLTNFELENVINFGTAGSINNSFNINDIIFCEKFFCHDVDLTIFGYKIGQLPNENNNYFKFQSDLKTKIKKNFNNLKIKTNKGNISSGDSFISKDLFNRIKIFKKEKIDIVDMESFSIAFVCKKFKINFLAIKLVSDLIKSNKLNTDFKKNILKNRITISELIKIIINNY